jgi:hypothetical protein
MTSKIKVDNIENQCGTAVVTKCGGTTTINGTTVVASAAVKTNAYQASDGGNIINQSSTTITLGASGDTIQLAGGASQTGFGREGSVDWQTSIKTGNFTAVSGEGYFINTTSGEVIVTLPSSPSVGDIVSVKDYANTADTNKITINRNGSNLDGSTSNALITNEGGSATFVYGDATKGWQLVEAAQKSDLSFPSYITATGGTITTVDTDYKVHTFTGPGTFTVTSAGNAQGSNKIDYMVIAGGGGGGHGQACYQASGGGGAGGYRESHATPVSGPYTASPTATCVSLPVSAQAYPITIGAGGAGAPATAEPNPGSVNGNNSAFAAIITSAGGGYGRGYNNQNGNPGGSGGGAGTTNNTPVGVSPASGGTGNTPPVSPPQGTNGGRGTQALFQANHSGGGGGGGTGAGGNGCATGPGGAGGTGATSSINGTPTGRAGGGSGSSDSNNAGPATSGGGAGGGAPFAPSGRQDGSNGTANTGGGGGGGAAASAPGNSAGGGTGGSGIVVIRYKFQN